MGIIYRQGTLSECIQVADGIAEFIRKETVESLSDRLMNKDGLIQIAEESGHLLGFKIGYQLDTQTFYSWFGGVSSTARNRGIAQSLLDRQEHWVSQQGYQHIRVKSRNQFPAMLRMLIRNGYLIEKFDKKCPIIESEVHFLKKI
ncbi:GNAT family N-acetyltransferase [Vibrio ostreicida]|uniref:GNAT family N-acetyltransferase n=1 Tax=Vibrio ostreicida TaxID=526588 RepID=UPI003B5BCF61